MTAPRPTRPDPTGDGWTRQRRWTAHPSGDGVEVAGPLRLTAWPNDPAVVQLVLVDHTIVPTTGQIADGVDRARELGYRVVRTSALFPRATDAALELGFRPIDTLVLLRSPVPRGTPPRGPDHRIGRLTRRHDRGPDHRIGRLTRRHDREAARVDRLAFGTTWGNDLAGIRAIRRATPWHSARCVVDPRRGVREVLGFVIAGAGGRSGYVQRLAVHPDHRRRGIADALLRDVSHRLTRRGVDEILVNTGTTNEAALSLYRRHGFVELRDRLVVTELELTPGRTGDAPADHEVVPTR